MGRLSLADSYQSAKKNKGRIFIRPVPRTKSFLRRYAADHALLHTQNTAFLRLPMPKRYQMPRPQPVTSSGDKLRANAAEPRKASGCAKWLVCESGSR